MKVGDSSSRCYCTVTLLWNLCLRKKTTASQFCLIRKSCWSYFRVRPPGSLKWTFGICWSFIIADQRTSCQTKTVSINERFTGQKFSSKCSFLCPSVRACVRPSVIHVVVLCFRDISSICWRIFAKLLSLVHFGTQMTWLRFWVKRSKFKVTPSRRRRYRRVQLFLVYHCFYKCIIQTTTAALKAIVRLVYAVKLSVRLHLQLAYSLSWATFCWILTHHVSRATLAQWSLSIVSYRADLSTDSADKQSIKGVNLSSMLGAGTVSFTLPWFPPFLLFPLPCHKAAPQIQLRVWGRR